jgi:hypothetical protein
LRVRSFAAAAPKTLSPKFKLTRRCGATTGALLFADQQAPAGAFARLPPGEYSIPYDGDADVGGGASVVWLSRTGRGR